MCMSGLSGLGGAMISPAYQIGKKLFGKKKDKSGGPAGAMPASSTTVTTAPPYAAATGG